MICIYILFIYGGHLEVLYGFLSFPRQVLDLFSGPGSMLSCFSYFLIHCFSAFLLLCFSCFSAFLLFAFPASLLFCFSVLSASLLRTSTILLFLFIFSHVFLMLYFLLLCFYASCLSCLFVFHFFLLFLFCLSPK